MKKDFKNAEEYRILAVVIRSSSSNLGCYYTANSMILKIRAFPTVVLFKALI